MTRNDLPHLTGRISLQRAMANPSHLSATGAYPVHPETGSDRTAPVAASSKSASRSERPASPRHAAADDSVSTSGGAEADGNILGPRKLIRPTLPARALNDRSFSRRDDPVLAHHAAMAGTHSVQESSHAEAFYFQKQMQSQTLMVFVLEDGEVIEGYIEWYDRNAVKVRNGRRTLIYKSGIKYLYKAGENRVQI
jgi:sRNA-binding regulator protein Hfq